VGELRYRGNRLWLRDRPIDVVYRFFSLAELTSGPAAAELAEPVLRAHASGAVRLFVPLDLAYVANKRTLSLLFEACHRRHLSVTERRLVDRLLPWTRQVPPGGLDDDLLGYCLEHQQNLVLKASRMHGGVGAVPGWQRTAAAWRAALCAAGGGSVVQERVPAVAELFPEPSTGELRGWTANWGMFLVDERYAGTFVRASPADSAGAVSMSTGAAIGCCLEAP
jgi:hypothetical protein